MLPGVDSTNHSIFDFMHRALDKTRVLIARDSPRRRYQTSLTNHAHNAADNRPSVFDESTVREQSSDEEDAAQPGAQKSAGLLVNYG
jgi:hypothetical protein